MSTKPFRPNGCGADDSLINPPDLVFTPACNEHDSLYHVGGLEPDRAKADSTFRVRMRQAARKSRWYLRDFYNRMAEVYYRAVRMFGKKHFNYKDKE